MRSQHEQQLTSRVLPDKSMLWMSVGWPCDKLVGVTHKSFM